MKASAFPIKVPAEDHVLVFTCTVRLKQLDSLSEDEAVRKIGEMARSFVRAMQSHENVERMHINGDC
jgi:mRNA-degrading endonuclease toxin of MazEF toxin-antitoxin module